MCRGFIIPKEIRDPEAISRFLDAVGQAESIIRESGLIGIRRLTTEEILGDEKTPGILNQYFTLNFEHSVNEDIKLDPGRMMIGDKILCMHTLTDLDDLPQQVGTDTRYERLSTDRSDCRLSFAAPVGLLLGCDHVYNQFIFLENHEEILERFERMGRNMNSLSQYSRSNAVNKEWIDLYLSEAHVGNLRSVRCHCNVMTWAENEDDLKRIRNDVGAQLALLGCTPHHNTVDVPALFWGAIPGNEADFPAEESFYTFLEPALCFFTAETNYRSSPSPFGIKMVDRHTGIPIHLDISDLPMKRGIIQNRNKCIVGPSGSGKSFITNHLVRQYWEQGAHIVLVDTGNSYKGLCELVNQKTHGKDGIYFTYTDENPICFNPFYTDDGIFDIEKRESIKTLILTLWKRENEPPTRAEEVALSNAVNLYLAELRKDSELIPSFNTFYEFVGSDYRRLLRQKNVREKPVDMQEKKKDAELENGNVRMSAVAENIRQYIDMHYKEDISLQSVAEEMNYSDAYFCKIFKQCFDKSFIGYLTEYRLERAKQLLADVRINVKDISVNVGYRDSNYFAKVFKRAMGSTPTEYRMEILKQMNKGNTAGGLG